MTTLTALLVAIWIGSAWWAVGIDHTPQFGAGVIGGQLSIGWFENMPFPPRNTEWKGPVSHDAPFRWWFHWQRSSYPAPVGSKHTQLSIPLWAIVLLVGLPTAYLWRRDRRRAPGLCPNCNYDLRANTTGICPECGHG